MTHYICTGGCMGVSDDPAATCGAEDCAKYGQSLTLCESADCTHMAADAGDMTTDDSGEQGDTM